MTDLSSFPHLQVDLVVQYKPPEDTDTYIHRSGRTGRAGRLGTSVVMYSESEWFKLARLEKSIQIKFEKLGMPSIRDVVAGLCAGQMEKIKGVDEQVIPYFEAFAGEMLEQGGLTPQEALARCMVAMTGRQLTVHRSVLTGQTGMTTILVEAKDPFREYDLFEHVKTLYDGEERIHIPQVAFLWNKPNAAVFDLDAAKAKLILAKSEDDPTFRMTVCEEMPRLDVVPFRGGGRGGDRRGSFGGGGGGRGSSYGGKSYGGGGGGYERRDRGSYSGGGGGNSWSKGGGASRGGGGGERRGRSFDFDEFGGGGDKFGGNKFGGDKFGGDKFGGDKYGGDKFDRPRSSAPRRSPAGAGAGPKKDESLDKFLSSLDWP
jgi:ATP-dependent RNA helicase DDX21